MARVGRDLRSDPALILLIGRGRSNNRRSSPSATNPLTCRSCSYRALQRLHELRNDTQRISEKSVPRRCWASRLVVVSLRHAIADDRLSTMSLRHFEISP
jgi:hypothetical protein